MKAYLRDLEPEAQARYEQVLGEYARYRATNPYQIRQAKMKEAMNNQKQGPVLAAVRCTR